MSSGRSEGSSASIMARQEDEEEHLGFSVFSSVVPWMFSLSAYLGQSTENAVKSSPHCR